MKPRRARLDALVVARGLADSIARAQALILANKVRVAGVPVTKAGQAFPHDAAITVESDDGWASRGAHKLLGAIAAFPWLAARIAGADCLDIGASTGGFTDVLLRHGARRVIALDVGWGQLHERLRQDPRVHILDRTNVRRQLTDSELIAAGLPAGGTARYVQDAGEQAKGWEVQVLFRPLKGYQISANYTNVDAIVTKTENVLRIGGPIAGRGKESGNLFQKFTFSSGPLKDLSLSNGLVWIDGTRPDAYDSATGKVSLYIPGYTRIDLGLGYRFALMGHACDLTVRVRNAADKHYIEGAQSKGDVRSYRIGLSGKF